MHREIEIDLSRRDFTINAMALELTSDTPTLVDPFNGAIDLMTRTLRTPLDPDISFSDDPLPILALEVAAKLFCGSYKNLVGDLCVGGRTQGMLREGAIPKACLLSLTILIGFFFFSSAAGECAS